MKKINPNAHAVARVTQSPGSEFGHIEIYIYEIYGFGSICLKISCQAGGLASAKSPATYAWRHGLTNDFAVVELSGAKSGYYLLLAIQNRLERISKDEGYPVDFADYATRVVRALKLAKVYVAEGLNQPIPSGISALPCYGSKDPHPLTEALRRMEETLLKAVS